MTATDMDSFYILRGENQTGPIQVEQITSALKGGEYSYDDLCWREGMSGWEPLRGRFSPPATPCKFLKASVWSRFFASVVDFVFGYLVIFAAIFMRVNYAVSYHRSHPDERLPGAPDWFFAAEFGLVVVLIVLRNSVWSGQSFGKRACGVIVVVPTRGGVASRLRCVWREFIFATILGILYFGCAIVLPQAEFMNIAGILLGGFLFIDCIFIVARSDGRRIVDLFAGTQVVNLDALKPKGTS